ncbi:MAG: hypothetical protein RLZZ66_652 [Pseudomonadota bacterium]
MKVAKLVLKNFRRFEDSIVDFQDDKNTTVFIGNNGAGKTAILDALVLNLSWLIARIGREKGKGKNIDDSDILNGTSSSIVDLCLNYNESTFHLCVTSTRKGHSRQKIENQSTEVSKLAEIFRQKLTEDSANASLPLIVYYPVNRVVVDVPLKIRTRHNFEQIDGYDNALQQGADFRRFFEWFRYREDIENELITDQYEQIFIEITENKLIPDWDEIKRTASITKDRQLNAVRNAIKLLITEFDNLRVERKPRLRMVVNKNGHKLDVGQLSQGEKSLMSLVGDIARRLAMMNPALDNPLDGEGIVLIDEVDMHLHPTWQRSVIANLNKTFPNCQFILTTHSPIVISEMPNLLVYALDDGVISKSNNLYGMDVNDVLLSEMHTVIRNEEIQSDLDFVLNSLQEGEIENAKLRCIELGKKIAIDNSELNRMQLLIKRLEFQLAKNN